MNLIGLYTLFYKEVLRFGKVLLQTLIAPVITALLYLLVFGQVFEGRVQVFPGVSYTMFLIPGLVMMSVIQNAFANSSSSLIQSKVTGNIVFMLLTPRSHLEVFLSFVLAGAVCANLCGCLAGRRIQGRSQGVQSQPLRRICFAVGLPSDQSRTGSGFFMCRLRRLGAAFCSSMKPIPL